MRISMPKSLVRWLVVVACAGMTLWAQQFQGSFTGIVTDATGAVIPGVQITAAETGTGFNRSAVSLEDGTFEIPLLPPGEYTLTAKKAGFETIARELLNLQVNAHVKIDFQMKIGAQTTTVTVEAAPPVLDTQTSSIGTTIGQQEAHDLPLNGRQFLELTLFTPGVVPGSQGSENSTRGGAINVNGMRESMNSFWLDGMDNTSIGVGQYVVAPPVDSVQEFRMETGMYDARFGANAGAQINVVTKSGTNQFRGTAYDFFRNGALDARNFFEPFVPHFVRNQFGGAAGGPVVIPHLYDGHNRTFVFGSYEGLRERRAFFNRARVPTLAERSGDFTDLLAPNCPVKTVLLNPLALLQGKVQPFTNIGQVLPQADPVGQALVNLYPKPNVSNAPCGGVNFTTQQTRVVDTDSFTERVDHRWGTKNTIFFRHSLVSQREFLPSSGVPGFGKNVRDMFQMAGLDWTHTLTPTALNEFKLAFNRWQLRWNNQDQGRMVGQQLGILGTPSAFRQTGVPNMSFAGYDGLGAPTNVPQAGAVNTFEFADTLTQVHGSHTVYYGGDIRSIRRGNFYIDEIIRNRFDFSGLVTGGLGKLMPSALGLPSNFSLGNGVADALLGLPTDWVRGFSQYISGAGSEYDAFIQDDWKVRPHLTLNFGLRYEYNSLVTDKQDRFASFDFNKGLIEVAGRGNVTLMNFDPTTGLYVPVGIGYLGSTARNRALQKPDNNNFAPRFGFAWQPFGDTKTVVRGGYGVFYDQTFGDVYFQKSANPPFVRINVGILPNALAANPALLGLIDTGQIIQNAFTPGAVVPSFPSLSPFQFNFDDALVHEWTLDIQRELPGSWLLDVAYLGTRGLHLPREVDPNQPIPNPVTQTTTRPFPNFDSNFSYTESSGASSYHALQVKAERHFSRGLAFIGGYTWSHSIDTNSTIFGSDRETAAPQDSYNLAAEKGSADFDFRHRFSLAYVYDLPFGNTLWKSQNSRVNYALEGWELSGVVALQSGAPFTPSVSGDRSHAEEGNDRPNVTGTTFYPAHQTPGQWVLASAFAPQPPYSFGNAGRNILRGPGLASWDFSLIRKFRLTESKVLEFRAEMFNLFNSANFNTPNRDIASPSFGQIFNTVQPIAGDASGGPGDPREVQFALKLIW